MRLDIAGSLVVAMLAMTTACPEAPPEKAQPPAPTCIDPCAESLDCEVGGLGADCVDGRCVIPPTNGSPPCVRDRDCDILVGTFSGLREFRCEADDDCVAPNYRGFCVAGHSSGVGLCSVPFFEGICTRSVEALDVRGRTVQICGFDPVVCVENECHAASTACTDNECKCSEPGECASLYFGEGDCASIRN